MKLEKIALIKVKMSTAQSTGKASGFSCPRQSRYQHKNMLSKILHKPKYNVTATVLSAQFILK